MSVVDAMAEVQSLDKPERIRNCSHLADHFISLIFEKYGGSDDTRLIFDRSIIYYRIMPSMLITKVTMKKLLSHTKTKDELAKSLVEQSIEYAERNGGRAVVTYGCKCKGTKKKQTRTLSCMHLMQQLMEQQR